MRNRFLAQIILVACLAAFGLTGCKNPPWKKGSKGAGGSGSESGVPPLGSGGENGIGERPMVGAGGLQHGQFAPVLFEYDSARIKPSEVSKLDAVAAYMKSNPGKLVIEGHCDERGTRRTGQARRGLQSDVDDQLRQGPTRRYGPRRIRLGEEPPV